MSSDNRNMIPAWVNGELTPVEKMRVHQEGLRHKAVSVFVMSRDKVLIQRRALSKYHTPGLWANTCCTHPLWNEIPLDCATRRLNEELGIAGISPVFRDHLEYRADVGNGLTEHEVVDIFVAEAASTLKTNLNPEEVMEVRWVSVFDLSREIEQHPDRFTAWLKIYLEKHANRIFGSLVQA
ncbi:isopentenyl-diphosphate Delta-isomerase [Litoreibacter janthinus]|uniref:Isopentenyl-diphosphate Delta-isomerase n=1 Tax=Litoreibacter janthinus TaxID=670154 RepID=A0A1I6FYU5_9RHOB|nr:isopentenyl-diphosphate Delta-isomerase [Litoreibacter janthinus]SFR35017.1 isopentenyl-diphosphate delta-isomerase [Litoreibacter janthinus]